MNVSKLFFVLLVAEDHVHDDTEDQRACDRGDGDLTEVQSQTTDTCDQNNGSYEEVLVLIEVNLLYHLQTGNCDETVESHADTAHDTGRNGVNKCNEGREEGDGNGTEGSSQNGYDRCVAGDSHTTNAFTVGGVGASAEECTGHGADTVTQQGSVETGILKKILFNDRRDILVVCNMLCENNKCNGNVSYGDGGEISSVQLGNTLESFNKGELGDGDKGAECDTILEEVGNISKVDYLESIDVCNATDQGEDSGNGIACENTEYEGDQTNHLLTVGCADCGDDQGNQTADECYEGGGNDLTCSVGNLAVQQIADSIACERKTDDGNGRTNNDSGHQLVDPSNTNELDDQRDNDINQACQNGTEDQAHVAEGHRNATGKGSCHRAEECEGRAKKYRALELGEELVNESTDTCTEQCGSGRHAVSDNDRNDQGCRHDGKQLLDGEDDQLVKLGFVADIVDELHILPPVFYRGMRGFHLFKYSTVA